MDIQKEINNLNQSHHGIDWSQLRNALNVIETALEIACGVVPGGPIKGILCGFSMIIKGIISQLPNNK